MPEGKICRQCHLPKPIGDFYVHVQMADGHLNKCKDCVKKRVKDWASDNPECSASCLPREDASPRSTGHVTRRGEQPIQSGARL